MVADEVLAKGPPALKLEVQALVEHSTTPQHVRQVTQKSILHRSSYDLSLVENPLCPVLRFAVGQEQMLPTIHRPSLRGCPAQSFEWLNPTTY